MHCHYTGAPSWYGCNLGSRSILYSLSNPALQGPVSRDYGLHSVFLKGLLATLLSTARLHLFLKPWIEGSSPLGLCLARSHPLEIRLLLLGEKIPPCCVATLDPPFQSHGGSMGSSLWQPAGLWRKNLDVSPPTQDCSPRSFSLSRLVHHQPPQLTLVPIGVSISLLPREASASGKQIVDVFPKMFPPLQV